MHVEQRREVRQRFHGEVQGRIPRYWDSPFESVVHGSIVDISSDGAGLIVNRSLAQYTVMLWSFRFAGVPVPVPVLAQVRWVERQPPEDTFALGLTFIL